ncbi:MAG: lytic transglycosylase domain-containing protein [Pyrinomonadaceae bacterium]
MRRSLILKTIALLLLIAVKTNGQEQIVRERARRYEPVIAAAAARYGVDPHLLWTIAYKETRFQPNLISPKGARGLMQFMPGTAVRYGLLNPHDPVQAIDAAARYISDLQKKFGSREDLLLAAYNAGEGAVEAYRDGLRLVLPTGKVINPTFLRTGGVPPYTETQGYVSGGTAIYRHITATNIFGVSVKLPNEVAPEEPERSMYMAVAQHNPPVSSVRTHSFYIP